MYIKKYIKKYIKQYLIFYSITICLILKYLFAILLIDNVIYRKYLMSEEYKFHCGNYRIGINNDRERKVLKT